MITAHTEVVGSFLRPLKLLKGRDDVVVGRNSWAEFKIIEDQAVDETNRLIDRQNGSTDLRIDHQAKLPPSSSVASEDCCHLIIPYRSTLLDKT